MQHLHKMMKEALNLYISEPEDSTRFANLPSSCIKKAKNIVEVAIDSQVARNFLDRYHRIKQIKN